MPNFLSYYGYHPIMLCVYGDSITEVNSIWHWHELQAFKSHKLHDPLESPGDADLTADVDFAFLRHCVSQLGGRKYNCTNFSCIQYAFVFTGHTIIWLELWWVADCHVYNTPHPRTWAVWVWTSSHMPYSIQNGWWRKFYLKLLKLL